MNKCKYAYDKSEPCCSDCNGEWFIINNEKIDSIECESFEPEMVEDNVLPWEEEKQEEVQTQIDENTKNNAVLDEDNTNTLEMEKNTLHDANINLNSASKATVKKLCYTSSCTVEIKGTYYKFVAGEEWELNDECDVEKERELLWNKINEEVDKQVKDVL